VRYKSSARTKLNLYPGVLFPITPTRSAAALNNFLVIDLLYALIPIFINNLFTLPIGI